MRRAWSLGLLVGAPILVLASLYMPWRAPTCAVGSSSSGDLADLFACGSLTSPRITGWSSPVGAVAALAALTLALTAVGALVWTTLRDRAPVLSLGLGVVYFVVALLAQTRHDADWAERQAKLSTDGDAAVPYHLAYGTYVGIAAGALVLLGVALSRSAWRPVPRAVRELGAGALTAALLVALLLPWRRAAMSADYTSLGVTDPSGSLAAVTALVLLFVLWLRDAARALAAGVALVTLLFAAAAFTTGFPFVHAYGGWLGISCAGAASLVLLTDRALVGSIQRPTAYAAAVVGSATAAVASFFLPWQTACYGTDADLNGTGLAGSCISSNGFAFGVAASTATLLTIVLAVVVAMLPWLRQIVAPLEAAVGLGLLTVTLGFRVETGDSGDATLGIGYGAIVGFVAIGTLIALTLVSMRWRWPNLRAVAPRVVPISLAAVFIAVVVVPWWGVLPDTIWRTFVPRFAALSWLTLASALIGIRLAFAWWRQAMGVDRAPELVLLSVGLVALTVLDATPLPSIEVNWNEGLLFALTLPLLLLALIEERGGLRNMRVPEVLRVDRL